MDTRTKQIKKDLEDRIDYKLLRDKYTEKELLEASDEFIECKHEEGKRIDIRYNLENGYCQMVGDAIGGEEEQGYSIGDNKEIRYYDPAYEGD